MLDRAEPMLDLLPRTARSDEEQKYLVAFLNPAELRYSGGANTALAVVRVNDGRAKFEDIGNLDAAKDAKRALYWKKVTGNPFHPRGKTHIQNATWAPTGRCRARRSCAPGPRSPRRSTTGSIAIDVPAIAVLVGVTGPIEVADVGTLDHDQPDPDPGRQLRPVQRPREAPGAQPCPDPDLPGASSSPGGQFVEKFQTLGEAAQARHFAVYFRDADAQAVGPRPRRRR